MKDAIENALKYLDRFQYKIHSGKDLNQRMIDDLFEKVSPYRLELRPGDKDEVLLIVDDTGKSTGLHAPRWLCHLAGLRHRVAEILLSWDSTQSGSMYLLQMRSWTKSDSPGHIDISVGGHVKGTRIDNVTENAYAEMEEELGFIAEDLCDNALMECCSYAHYDSVPAANFYNSEWRIIYNGTIKNDHLKNVRFKDGEVVGLYLCPVNEAQHLLNQTGLPLGSALVHTLPKLL